MSKKPHIFAHCAAGCKWEVPHKTDTPYYEKVATLKNKTLSLGDAVEVADVNMLYSALLGETVKLTIEVTYKASYQGSVYTAFFTADNVYRNWLIPTDECGFVEMVVSYSGSDPTTVSLILMTDTEYIVKVKEFVVCQLGAAVFAMTGATAIENGKTGTVPAPAAGEQDFVLHGDGTWREPKLFIAKMGETTYAEVYAARLKDKAIFCQTANGGLLPIADFNDNTFYFSGGVPTGIVLTVALYADDTWACA